MPQCWTTTVNPRAGNSLIGMKSACTRVDTCLLARSWASATQVFFNQRISDKLCFSKQNISSVCVSGKARGYYREAKLATWHTVLTYWLWSKHWGIVMEDQISKRSKVYLCRIRLYWMRSYVKNTSNWK